MEKRERQIKRDRGYIRRRLGQRTGVYIYSVDAWIHVVDARIPDDFPGVV
jgi:hypothetical protein